MIRILNRDELLKIANDRENKIEEKERNFLIVVANSLDLERNIQVRLQETSNKKVIKVYKYDRFLYRFILDTKIEISWFVYNFVKSRNYIIIKNISELRNAMSVDVCRFIIMEENNCMNIWERLNGKWIRERYVLFGEVKNSDIETTGSKAYQSFYSYIL